MSPPPLWQTAAIAWPYLATRWQDLAIARAPRLGLLAAALGLASTPMANANTNETEWVRAAYSEALTPKETSEKSKARATLNKMGLGKLRVLLEHVHIPNMYIRFDIDSLVHRNRDKVGPILLPFVDSPHHRTRSYAAYYLGFTPLREHREKLIPLLDDPNTRTPAIRTLGKWAATNQIDAVAAYLDDDNERRRITSINAIGDIGDPDSAKLLLPSLDDPMFTVRFVGERALTKLGNRPVIEEALETASPKARWHLENVLKEWPPLDATP